jgi:cation transport regulator ChaC
MSSLKVLGIALILGAFFLGFNIPTWFENKPSDVEQLLKSAEKTGCIVNFRVASTQELPDGYLYDERELNDTSTVEERTMYNIQTKDGHYLGCVFIYAKKYE